APREAHLDGLRVHRSGGRHTFALHARGVVRRLLRANSYDVVVEDVNKLPLFLPTLTDRPFCALLPHPFGSPALRAASWPTSGPWHSRGRRVPTWSSKSPEGAMTVRASSAWRGRWAWARLRGSSGSCPRRISVGCCVVRGPPCWRARRRVGASRTWRRRRAV